MGIRKWRTSGNDETVGYINDWIEVGMILDILFDFAAQIFP